MNLLILKTANRLLFPMLLLFSVYMTLRGHNAPGGGFIGGLVAASAFALLLIVEGPQVMLRALRVHPTRLLGAGLALAGGAGLVAWLARQPYMTGIWGYLPIGWGEPIKLGTPLFFDLGVFLAVVGFLLTIVLTLEES